MEKMAWTAASLGCEAVQVFSRSPRGGKAKALAPSDVAAARSVLADKDIWPLVVHVPYYLNLASSDPEVRGYSIDVMTEDLRRTEMLGGRFLVTHIGRKSRGEETDSPDVLARVLASADEVLRRYSGPVKVLLENTAGQGQEIGSSFEAIAALLRSLPAGRAGACLDTCHAFGAGYDFRGEAGVHQVLTAFDTVVGLSLLGAIHLNDSKGGLGSRIDRHEHIGRGQIGFEAFRALANSPLLPEDLPGLLETPVDEPGDDLANVKTMKELRVAYAAT
jgi:deoxyribonuclease-4